ncbi:s20: ribosomal protein S20 [Thermacetogenium phaeum DSM 12270]|uniref:Small ribosomal subunit protein bS20 n=1 Tax=Thermacetogenium phaeum (strain ATCC BAA-254 / DSM 26808 / PB) TaxID=1089553 RepID=K4LHI0_THEPS|nr:30S ribosomal protein S20 [Thermacetogenium phaeum]AFV12318.1 s20: ribosomal protein S20 [Thermacetogenium phaeum DSM 12270]MDK2880626.1 small subunit ribosomal protein [Clostridia bacterium]
MANTKSAIKRAKTARKRQLRNASYKSAMKTAIKKFEAALAAGDRENLEATYRKAIRLIDKVATKGVIHPNTRDRKKSKLARKLNQALA